MKMRPEWFVILILVFALILQRSCCSEPNGCPDVELVNTETGFAPKVFKEILRDTVYPKPVIVWKDSLIEVEVPADVDTAEILALYFQKHFYSDTIHGLDTGLHYRFSAVVNDSVYQNKIQHRQFLFLDLKPTTINEYSVADPKNKWFIGGQVGGNVDHIDAGISLMLLTKKDHGYAYTYQAFSNTHNVTLYWKISLRK